MNLSQRFAALLGVFGGVFFGAIFVLHWLQNEELSESVSVIASTRRVQLDRALEQSRHDLSQFSLDYSLWDELVGYIAKPTPEWIAINITPSLEKFGIDKVWICEASGDLIYSASRATQPPPDTVPPLAPNHLLAAPTGPIFSSYFTRLAGVLHEVHVSPIQPSADIQRKSRPLGWLIAARKCDDAYLKNISDLLGGTLSLCEQAHTCGSLITTDKILLTRKLDTLPGEAPAEFHYDYFPHELQHHMEADNKELMLLAGHGIFLIIALSFSVHFWVIRPLTLIKSSLTQANPELLIPIRSTRSEIGDLARIVRTHYAHQKALQENIDNNARLQRDLHDGVLQTIYAAGMGLALSRNLIRENPDEAERRLDQSGLQLNQLIRDIRAYLSHLTPDAHPALSLADSIHALIDWYKKLHPFEADLHLSPDLPLNIPIQIKSEILLLLREAISNSLRHAHTDRIIINLHPFAPHHLQLIFRDDGIGFDPTRLTHQGHGLNNMKTRAQELGGTCQIVSARGQGTTLTLTFPLPPDLNDTV